MKQMKKQTAVLLAGMLCAVSIGRELPQFRFSAEVRKTVLQFSREADAMPKGDLPAQQFSDLYYSEAEGILYLDGTPCGKEAAGFRIENGELTADPSAFGLDGEQLSALTPEQATTLLGCEISEQDDGMHIRAPFQNAALIVKSEVPFDTHGAIASCSGYENLYLLHYQTPADAYQAYQAISADDSIIFAEPNRTVSVSALPSDDFDADSQSPPGDWGFQAVGCDNFMQFYPVDPENRVTVAVVDSGIYMQHNWFKNRIAEGGCSFISEESGSVNDQNGHGTHCAGIICRATPENVSVLPLKALNALGSGSTLDIYCAVEYALEQKADIISMSLNGMGESPLLESAARDADAAGVTWVVSAGNFVNDVKYYEPANISSLVVVSSVSMEYDKNYGFRYVSSDFSNYGSAVDFSAPGDEIESASISGPDETCFKSGTSMAAPLVAACFANLLQYIPSLTSTEMYEYLRMNATDLGDPGFDPLFGFGMVNLDSFAFCDGGCAAPYALTAGGEYDSVFSVSLACDDDSAKIYYTTDGTAPGAGVGTLYDGQPIQITDDCDLYAVAYSDYGSSRMLHEHYTILVDAPKPSIPSGFYIDEEPDVEFYSSENAAVYYTTDGTLPDRENGILYDGTPIHISETTLLMAVAYIGDKASDVTAEDYIINDTHYERLFDVRDGVLYQYRGSLKEIDLSRMLKGTNLVAIGENAFAGNYDLESVILPDSVKTICDGAFSECEMLWDISGKNVTSVGERAFYRCPVLSDVDFPQLTEIGDAAFCECERMALPPCNTDNLTKIGADAFRRSDISGSISLGSLKSLGANAFAQTYMLREVELPETLTELPDGLFSESGIKSLKAPGAVKIGSRALYSVFLNELELPFSEMTEVGDSAFEFLSFVAAGTPHLKFDKLTSVGSNAFANAETKSMYFSALTEIPSEAFANIVTTVLYLPAVKTIKSRAISCGYQEECCIAVGDSLEFISEQALADAYINQLAGPLNSPLEVYANSNHIVYECTPALFVPQFGYTFLQDEEASIEAYPLGFDVDVKFRSGSTEIIPENGFSIPIPTKKIADTEYYAELYQDGVLLSTSLPITVSVQVQTNTGIIANVNEPVMVQWDSIPLNEWETLKAEYTFTAPHEGDYYIFDEEAESTITFVREDGTRFFQDGSGCYPSQLKSIYMNANETVTILVETSDHYSPAVILTVTQEIPDVSICNGKLTLQKTIYPKTTGILTYGTRLFMYNSSLLTENEDYIVFAAEMPNRKTGMVYAVGIGDYCGVVKSVVYLYDELDYQSKQTLTGLSDIDDTSFFSVSVPESDYYTLTLDFTDEQFAQFENKDNELFWTEAEMILYDDNMNYYCSGERFYTSWLPQLTTYLETGTTYYLGVISYNEFADELDLICMQNRESYSLLSGYTDMPFNVEYNGKPYVPDYTVYNSLGEILTEGEDYRSILMNNYLPGYAELVVTGINDYFGTMLQTVLLEPASDIKAGLDLKIGDTFRIEKKSEALRFELDASMAIRFNPLDGQGNAFDSILFYRVNTEYSDNSWIQYAPANQIDMTEFLFLSEGEYMLFVYQDSISDCRWTFQTDGSCDISEAVIRTEPLYYTGNKLAPKLSVTYQDMLLQEGMDYYISSLTPIEKIGKYSVQIIGKEPYFGKVNAMVTVLPNPDMKVSTASDGDNTAEITNPGGKAIMYWTPSKSYYCLRKTDYLCEDIFVCDAFGNAAAVVSTDAQDECIFHVWRGQQYYIYMNFSAESQTGTIHFALLPDYRDISECSLEAPETVLCPPAPYAPDIVVTDGDYVLQENRDYRVWLESLSTEPGHCSLVLQGLGRYIGTLEYDYYQYLPFGDLTKYADAVNLTLDVRYDTIRDMPGTMRMFRFTAETSSSYYLDLQAMENTDVVTLIYGPDGDLLPMDTRKVYLDAWQTVTLFCVTERTEADSSYLDSVSLAVTSEPPKLLCELDGYVYQLENGFATLIQVPDGQNILRIPEMIYDPVNDITCQFNDISYELGFLLSENYAVVTESDNSVADYCRANGICYLIEGAESDYQGDLNGDQDADLNDVKLMMILLNESGELPVSSSVLTAADRNQDGMISMDDVCDLLRFLNETGAV